MQIQLDARDKSFDAVRTEGGVLIAIEDDAVVVNLSQEQAQRLAAELRSVADRMVSRCSSK